jgi:glycerophosphoryl diester phosphodiesterase
MSAQNQFTIIAHRGDSSAAPENTVQAFDTALNKGFCNFETDCQLSSDGAVIIVHDEQLGRVNDGTGAVADHTLAQLQQLDAGSWFGAAFAGARMPMLQQLLETYKGRAHIHLVSWDCPSTSRGQVLCKCC